MKETLLEYIDCYAKYCLIIKNLSINTVNSYVFTIKQFFQYVNSNIFNAKYTNHLDLKMVDVKQLKEQDFYNYICYLIVHNINIVTRKQKMQSIKLFFDYLYKIKHILIFNPVNNIEKEKSRIRIYSNSLSKNDSIKLFHYISKKGENIRDKAIISLLINCGLRNNELRSLKLSNINLKENKFNVLGKGRKERVCYLNLIASKNLKDYLIYREQLIPNCIHSDLLFFNNRFEKLNSNDIVKIVRYVYKNNDINYEKYNVHSLRHTFATDLYMCNTSLNIIKEALGHSSIEATQFYIHIDKDKMKQLVNCHPLACTNIEVANKHNKEIGRKYMKNVEKIENINLKFTREQIDIMLDSIKIYMELFKSIAQIEEVDNNEINLINKNALLKYTYAYLQSFKYNEVYDKEGRAKCNNTENLILELLENNNSLTQIQIAKILNLSGNCIYKNLRKLKEKGLIFRIGANKNGYWNLRDKLR